MLSRISRDRIPKTSDINGSASSYSVVPQPQTREQIKQRETDMEATAMDVEEQSFHPIPISSHRFGLKNSIQTNFGDDYVFQIVSKDDWSAMAVSLSSTSVKLYSVETGQYFGECKGHSSTIHQIMFSGASDPHVLNACSSDGTIRAWDTRTYKQMSCISAGPSQELFSFSFGGPNDNLIVAGCKSQILFWDWRTGKHMATLEDAHMEDVTQVHFVPDQHCKLLSASVDGLICTFDVTGSINDDDSLESVINVETSIARVGLFGESYRKLWCLTHTETLSVWDWKDARSEANFADTRLTSSESWSLDQIDYLIDCHCCGESEQLWLIGGTNSGILGYFPVNYRETSLGSPDAILEGGHTNVVRSVLSMSAIHGKAGQSQSLFGWTGGEDGRLCCWESESTSLINRSWTSGALIMRPDRMRNKNRHQPY